MTLGSYPRSSLSGVTEEFRRPTRRWCGALTNRGRNGELVSEWRQLAGAELPLLYERPYPVSQ